MIDIRRAGSFDDEPDELRACARKWVLKVHGPTPRQRRDSCHCPPCRVLQEAEAEDRAAFIADVEARRVALLIVPLLFND